MQTIEEGWKEFEEMAPADTPPEKRAMMRGAFYRGALWLHSALSTITTSEEVDNFAVQLHADLEKFVKTTLEDGLYGHN